MVKPDELRVYRARKRGERQRWQTDVAASLAMDTMSAMPDTPAEAVGRDLPASTGEVVGSGPGEYLGYDVRETGGTNPVTIVLYDNASAASGTILEEIKLVAGAEADELHDRPGKQVVNGIYASYTGTGVVQGAIYQ